MYFVKEEKPDPTAQVQGWGPRVPESYSNLNSDTLQVYKGLGRLDKSLISASSDSLF